MERDTPQRDALALVGSFLVAFRERTVPQGFVELVWSPMLPDDLSTRQLHRRSDQLTGALIELTLPLLDNLEGHLGPGAVVRSLDNWSAIVETLPLPYDAHTRAVGLVRKAWAARPTRPAAMHPLKSRLLRPPSPHLIDKRATELTALALVPVLLLELLEEMQPGYTESYLREAAVPLIPGE